MLYAALTARWPGETSTAPARPPRAPMTPPCHPRQVRAGVPHDLDELTCRALGLPGTRKGGLTDPGELARALEAGAGGTTRLPAVGRDDRPERRVGPRRWPPPRRRTGPPATSPAAGPARSCWPGSRRRSSWSPGWCCSAGSWCSPRSTGTATAASPAADEPGLRRCRRDGTQIRRLGIAGVRAFDPEGDGRGARRAGRAGRRPRPVDRLDDDADYFDPLELQKSGVGLVLDLGAPADVSEVVIRPQGGPTDIEVRVSAGRADARCPASSEFDGTSNATGPTDAAGRRAGAHPLRAGVADRAAGRRRRLPREHQRGDGPRGRATRRR